MRLWLLLTCVAVFAAGAAVGALAFLDHRRTSERRSGPQFFFSDYPFERLTSEEFYRDLGLDERQRDMITHLLSIHEKRVREIRTSLSELASELRTGIDTVLLPEQKDQLKRIQSEYEERDLLVRVSQEVQYFKRELSLTPEEEALVQPIFIDYAHAKKEVWQSNCTDKDAKFQEIRDARNTKMKEVLPLEKYAKFAEIKGRRGPPGDRTRRRGGGPEGAPKEPEGTRAPDAVPVPLPQ